MKCKITRSSGKAALGAAPLPTNGAAAC